MLRAFNKVLILSLFLSIFCFRLQAAPICSDYLSTSNISLTDSSDLELVTKKLVDEFVVYTPWYYFLMKTFVSEAEIGQYLINTGDDQLKVIADGILQGLMDENLIKINLSLADINREALFMSLKAIQASKKYPVRMVHVSESSEGRKTFAKVLLGLSGISAVAIMPLAYKYGFGEQAIVASSAASALFMGSVVAYVNSESEDFVDVDKDNLAQFILSNGTKELGDLAGSENYFSFNDEGQIILGKQYVLVIDRNGNLSVVRPRS